MNISRSPGASESSIMVPTTLETNRITIRQFAQLQNFGGLERILIGTLEIGGETLNSTASDLANGFELPDSVYELKIENLSDRVISLGTANKKSLTINIRAKNLKEITLGN